jgi:hypothetical protein
MIIMLIIIMIIRTLVVLDCREGGLAVPEHNCDNAGCLINNNNDNNNNDNKNTSCVGL